VALGIVRVLYVMYLEAERVLQVVARLLVRQAGHDNCPFRYVYDIKVTGLGQRAGNLADLLCGWYSLRLGAQVKLGERADIAQFADTDVAVVIRQAMDVGHGTRRLPKQRGCTSEGAQYPPFQGLRHDLAPGGLVLGLG
jgi:hypothetical protein